ncbi:hypothetical protein B0H17DRAFT_645943 [Mycena rosella]|uniref:Uncharacterized protein n=1 Tax=Mycena rosella TaxID=1033263 RepID=A0AAD7DDG8_MYCRO|nr:hypothetical protein B0H17DRAFT_645943 [Mycena rosella]
MLSTVTAALTEALVEMFLYGVYAVLLTAVIYLVRSRRGSLLEKKSARWVLFGLIIQFLVITGHCINTICETFLAIVRLGGGAAAEAFYLDLSTTSSVVHITLLVMCTLVTDILVIHRLYVICSYTRNIVLFPLAILVAQAAGGVGSIYHFARWYSDKLGSTKYLLLDGWVVTHLVSSIVISAYCSGMIYWKIRGINRAVGRLSGHIGGGMKLTSVLAILVESAAIQTATTIGALVTFQVGFIGVIAWSGISPAVLGISTVLIHARIGLGWAHEPDYHIGSNPTRINFAGNDALQGAEHELENRK